MGEQAQPTRTGGGLFLQLWGKRKTQGQRSPRETSGVGEVGGGGIQWEGYKQEGPKGRKDGDTHRKGLRGGTMASVSGTGVPV